MTAREIAPVTFVGHPYAAIGKGEELRSNLRALMTLDEPVEVLDIYRAAPRNDNDYRSLIDPIETRRVGRGTRIFHLNGDEIEPALRALEALGGRFEAGRNIVVPAWELPDFPRIWVHQLKRFDEVWAISRFVQDSLASSGISSHYVGQSVDLPIRPFLSRRFFGIRESAFVFLTTMDFSSFAARKNPWAAINTFRRLLRQKPFDDIQLVVKMKGDTQAAAKLAAAIDLPRDNCVLLDRQLTTFEQHSLIASCDCLISLHRSEGFGRGPGEAMRLGRLALATGWSGNVDFMDERNSLLVNYQIVPVAPGEYPESEGQCWADPDIDHATHLARSMLDDQGAMRDRIIRGFHDVIRRVGSRAVGLRMLQRLQA